MKRVDVYEVSRRVQTTELDHVEFHQAIGRRYGPASDWVDVPPEDDELPKFVRHSSPVIQLRHPVRPDVYLAIGPELFELLAPAVDVGLYRLLEDQREPADQPEDPSSCDRSSSTGKRRPVRSSDIADDAVAAFSYMISLNSTKGEGK